MCVAGTAVKCDEGEGIQLPKQYNVFLAFVYYVLLLYYDYEYYQP